MKSTQQATDLCHTFLVKLLHDVLKVQQVQKKTPSQLKKVLYYIICWQGFFLKIKFYNNLYFILFLKNLPG